MSDYNFKEIENKWKSKWYENNIYKAVDFSDKPKKYILAEFPYPSGKSMHVGHMMRYTLPEIYSRYLRMKGFNVMFPMGWDAFGLPAENYAIKTGTNPADLIKELTKYYKDSMQDMGYGVDWDREINTTDPGYYKWTQWIFLKFWEAGLAEMREEPVWWSEKMKTVLAEEEVVNDKDGNLVAERDGSPVVKKMLKQWMLKIPKYADKLIDGLKDIDFPESVKAAQTNWIGRSYGTRVKFPILDFDDTYLECFTTRIDTIYGVTFIVIAPEHEIVQDFLTKCENPQEVKEYIEKAKAKTELDRQQNKEKTGVELKGVFATNPFEIGEKIKLFVADYVLKDYGTGIVMGVPAHDERDFEFAKNFGLKIIPVIAKKKDEVPEIDDNYECFADYGYVVNSKKFTGMTSEDAKEKMTDWLIENKLGNREVNYKIRDWLFSRQRYWGEAIPLIHKEDDSIEAIAQTTDKKSIEENLPLTLPEVPDYNPTPDGLSPLAANTQWVNTKASDGSPAKREVNTMPNWAGSCWYFLRYIDPKNDTCFADFEKMKYWLPVDKYFGGAEHTTLHLLYSRFWHQFLYDQGLVPTPEPYGWRMNGGILLGPDGYKMSKSRGNVVEPQDKLDKYGADALRMYVAFMGPYDGTFPYSENGLKACHKVLQTVNSLRSRVSDEAKDVGLEKKIHQMAKNITEMADSLKMNTIVSEIMIFVKSLKEAKAIPVKIWKMFIKLIAPISPFIAEDLWQEVNGYTKWVNGNSVHLQEWPEYDEKLLEEDKVTIPVQINGKMRGSIEVAVGSSEDDLRAIVLATEAISKYINGAEIKRFVYVPNKIVNIVI